MQCQPQVQAHTINRGGNPICLLAFLPSLTPWPPSQWLPNKDGSPEHLPLFCWSRREANWTSGSIAKPNMSVSSTTIQNTCKQGTECVLGQDRERKGLGSV